MAAVSAAPTTASQAAAIILNGVRNKQWRILVGNDAIGLDEMVRQDPENACTIDFFARMQANSIFDQTQV